jgi:transglutaminase-like putative cysteine protease
MELKSLRINTGPTSTGTVFQPQKAVEITPEGDYFLIQNEMGDKRMSDIMERYSDYYADYFDVDYKNENILEALKGSKKGYYNDMAGEYERMMEENTVGTLHLRKMRIGSLISLFRNIYAPQAEAIYSKYSSLPTGISQRLYDLANEITKDNDNDYDKLKAIESYLQNNEYTVTPAIIRPDIDFVEGFLFETREGYCTYYASAMAVLSRAIGLPARYVEGYTTPSELTGDYYVVTNLNAHAWAEVYLEGFGWVPFEATPPNYQALYVEKTESGEFRGNEYHELIDDEEMLERMPHLGDVTKERTENNMNFLHYVSFWELVAVIMASFAFLAFFRVLWVTRKEHNIERMIRSEGVIEYYKLILRFLSFYGYSLRDEESAVIYANRVGKHTPMGTNKLRIASEVFSKARYGQGEIPEESYNFVKNIYVQMLMYFKFNTPRVKYYLFRYFKR